MSLGDVAGVARYGKVVKPQLRAFLRDRIGDLDAILRFDRAFLGLLDVTGKPDDEADFAGSDRIEKFGRVKLAHRRSDLHHEVGRLLQIGLLGGIRVEAEIVQCRSQNVVGGIEKVDAALLELYEHFGSEDKVPAVERGARPKNVLCLAEVVADP